MTMKEIRSFKFIAIKRIAVKRIISDTFFRIVSLSFAEFIFTIRNASDSMTTFFVTFDISNTNNHQISFIRSRVTSADNSSMIFVFLRQKFLKTNEKFKQIKKRKRKSSINDDDEKNENEKKDFFQRKLNRLTKRNVFLHFINDL